MTGDIYLVTPADYDLRNPFHDLTPEGVDQAHAAAEELKDHGVNDESLVLTSPNGGPYNTARVIGGVLKAHIMKSEYVSLASKHPDRVGNLLTILEREKQSYLQTGQLAVRDLVVISAPKLVIASLGLDPGTVLSPAEVRRFNIAEPAPIIPD